MVPPSLLSIGTWAAAKKLILVWRGHHLLSGFLVNNHLSRVSCELHLSDLKGETGTVHRSPGIYLIAKESSGKPQLGDNDEGCAPYYHLI